MKEREFLIDGIWILDIDSGLCLFEENYVDFKKEGISRDLITGFLSAIINFIGEAFNDKLQFIMFSNHKILFKFYLNKLLFVVAINTYVTNNPEINSHVIGCIDDISERFYEKFHSRFENGGWDGYMRGFKAFSHDLRDIIKRKPLSIKLLTLEKIKRKKRKKEERRKQRREYSSKFYK